MHANEGAGKLALQLREREPDRLDPADQHIIVPCASRKIAETNCLAQPASGAVADNCVADLFRQREADPRRACVLRRAGGRLQAERLAVPAFAFRRAQKIGAAEKPADLLRGMRGGVGRQAESRLRPRARRVATTFRPPTVAMRARKPWRRLRTSFEG